MVYSVLSHHHPKPVIWVGPSRRELRSLPRQVQRTMGIALREVIFVLAAFQKKSRSGTATPGFMLDRIADRLRQAREIHEGERQ